MSFLEHQGCSIISLLGVGVLIIVNIVELVVMVQAGGSGSGSVNTNGIGINYGQIANNLPSPDRVVPLVHSIGASKVKLYDADPSVLKAFANTGVEIMVCIPNDYLPKIKSDSKQASDWIRKNVQPYLPATRITSIVVGNEVLTYNDSSLSQSLLPAMRSVYSAVSSLGLGLGLGANITVTTTHSLSELSTSYPPSAGVFRSDLADCVSEILEFNSKTGSPFLINAYPFFAYKADPKHISLDFVLFQPNQGVVDPSTGLRYDNMLFSQIDAVYSALSSLGYKDVPVHISETGWPSKGDDDEVGATPDNAKRYNSNLIKLIMSQKKSKLGTPMRPDADLNIFLFALFNENLKPGPTSERNYGLFKPDGTLAYPLGLTGVQAALGNGTRGPRGGGTSSDDTAAPTSPDDTSSSSMGYLSISPAQAIRPSAAVILLVSSWMCLLPWTLTLTSTHRYSVSAH